MLDGKDYPPGTPIYTFVDKDGTNTHIDSEKLRLWCAENKRDLLVQGAPVEQAIAHSFITENVINPQHLFVILEMPSLDPIIYGKTGTFAKNGAPDVMLIDGHHRYYLAWLAKMSIIPAYVLEVEQWKPFQIEGLPNVTEEQLRNAPVKKKKRV